MNKRVSRLLPAFTLPELIIVVTVFVTLLIVATINLINVKQQTSLNTTIDLLIGDLKQQQLKAMVGDTEGSAVRSAYGIHFNEDSYVLFRGQTYNSNDPANFTIQMGDSIECLDVGEEIIFAAISGEVASGAATLQFRDVAASNEKSVTVNNYGVVTAVIDS